MIPAWTVCIPLGLLLACIVLALETRPRVLALCGLAGFAVGLAGAFLLAGVIRL